MRDLRRLDTPVQPPTGDYCLGCGYLFQHRRQAHPYCDVCHCHKPQAAPRERNRCRNCTKYLEDLPHCGWNLPDILLPSQGHPFVGKCCGDPECTYGERHHDQPS